MRRLLLLLIGWAIAWAGLRLLGDGEPAPYLLRDALLLLLPGAAFFAWRAPAAPAHARTLYTWTGSGRALFVSGAATALAGAALGATGVPFAAVVWLIGLGILLAGALLPAPVTRYTPAPGAEGERVSRRFTAVALVLVLAVGAALRFWRLGALPPVCSGDECARALALARGAPAPLPTFDALLGALFYFFSSDGLLSVRLAGALIGVATLPAVFALGQQVGSPAAALLATLLLALDPAHVAAARAGDPWITLPLLAALALWAGWRALAADDHRQWAVAGLTTGLLALHAPALLLAWLLWFAAMLALAATQKSTPRAQSLLLLAAAALPAAAPLLWSLPPAHWTLGTFHFSLFTFHWPLTPALAALAWVGAATLVRRGRPALLYFAGFTALLLGFALGGDAAPPANAWLASAAWLLAGFAAACATLLATAARAGRPLLRVQPAFALLFAAALALGVWRGGGLNGGAPAAAESPASAALAETIAAALGDSTGTTIFAPAAVLGDPRVQLAAAAEIAAGRIRLLDPLTTLPYTGDAAGDLLYIFTPAVAPLADVARQLYPDGSAEAVRGEDGSLRFTILRVPAAAESRGLRQYLYRGGEFGGADEAEISTVDRALDFGWAAYPPLPGPFSAEWQGSLVAPLAGEYAFAVQSGRDALFSLLLDGQLVLDSTAGLISHTLDLPAGVYRLDMRYRPGVAPGDWAVLWQPPGRNLAPIPAEALHAPPAPASGLVGTYTAGAAWDGAPIARRKDWLLGADPALAPPYSVVWLGKLAASRAGETLLGAVSDGTAIVTVDGKPVIERFPGPDAGAAPSEGAIYLEQGWHDLEIRYATGDGVPELKLYWQPPGAQPEPLPVAALAPTSAPITAADRPLPPPPELADARLGDDSFALTAANELWRPAVVHPPAALPYLPFEQVATFGACGSGDGQFAAPHGLAFDATGETLYVADTDNRRVVALDLANGATRTLPGDFEEPADVEVAPDGSILALDATAARIVRHLDPGAPGVPLPLPNAYRPRGLGGDALGMAYVADTGRGRVVLIAPDGAEVGDFGGEGSALAAGQPVDVLAAPSAIWAVTPVDGRLRQLNTQGSLGVMAPGDTLDGPHLAGLWEGGFFLSVPNRAAVVYFDARGRPLGELSYAGAFTLPTGVAAHLAGDTVRLAVADTAACAVSLWEMPAARLPR